MRRLPLGVLVFAASLVLAPLLACKGASRPASLDATSCPAPEPAASSACALAVGQSCTYGAATSRDVHCHCIGAVWDCGTPLGIDTTAPPGTCPSTQPATGAACTLTAPPPPSPGDRPGCFYQVAMTVTHDCLCAHYGDHAVWDCGLRSGTGPTSANGCPARKPLDDTQCLEPADVDCQYGYNLATTCNCKPRGASGSAWKCNTVAQPPSPR